MPGYTKPVPKERELLSPTDIWRVYGVSRSTIYRWRDTGKLKHQKLGERVRIRRSDIEKLMKPSKKSG